MPSCCWPDSGTRRMCSTTSRRQPEGVRARPGDNAARLRRLEPARVRIRSPAARRGRRRRARRAEARVTDPGRTLAGRAGDQLCRVTPSGEDRRRGLPRCRVSLRLVHAHAAGEPARPSGEDRAPGAGTERAAAPAFGPRGADRNDHGRCSQRVSARPRRVPDGARRDAGRTSARAIRSRFRRGLPRHGRSARSGTRFRQAEIRATRDRSRADGAVGARSSPPEIGRAIMASSERFESIDVPALAIYASPHTLGPWAAESSVDPAVLDAFRRFDQATTERQAQRLRTRSSG